MQSDVKHGGRRDGAGRKPLEGGRVTAAFVLRQDQLDWIALQARELGASKSEVMRKLLDDWQVDAQASMP